MHLDPAELEAEIALLQRVGKGDRESFSELYDRFSNVLFSVALRIVNDREYAQDVLQEVFLQIWEKAPLYDETRGKPLTWAITLTRNRSIDRLRSMQRRHRLSDEVEKESQTDDQFDDRNSHDHLDLAETGALVRKAMSELPKEQREAIELAFFSGFTQSEIAVRMGEPLGTVKARIRRGMLKLRDALEARR